MAESLPERIRQIQPKLHAAALGMTLSLGTYFASQGGAPVCAGGACPASAVCPAGGVCAAQLPVVALPLLVDGAVLLAGKVLSRTRNEPQTTLQTE